MISKVISKMNPVAPSKMAKINVWFIDKFPEGSGRQAVLAIFASICFSMRQLTTAAAAESIAIPRVAQKKSCNENG